MGRDPGDGEPGVLFKAPVICPFARLGIGTAGAGVTHIGTDFLHGCLPILGGTAGPCRHDSSVSSHFFKGFIWL